MVKDLNDHSDLETSLEETYANECELYTELGILTDPPVQFVVNSADADVTFRSGDGVMFKIHSVYLNATTEKFAIPPGTKLSQAVDLDEHSDILAKLFQFVYPKEHPDLEDIEFARLRDLAAAAEKYRVYAAMNVCKIRM
ncbi:hypothetical protein H0H92_005184, partial [Tricholoma furcatifolium]